MYDCENCPYFYPDLSEEGDEYWCCHHPSETCPLNEDEEALTLESEIDRVGQEIASVKTEVTKLNEDLADLRTRFEKAREEMYARLEEKIMSYK